MLSWQRWCGRLWEGPAQGSAAITKPGQCLRNREECQAKAGNCTNLVPLGTEGGTRALALPEQSRAESPRAPRAAFPPGIKQQSLSSAPRLSALCPPQESRGALGTARPSLSLPYAHLTISKDTQTISVPSLCPPDHHCPLPVPTRPSVSPSCPHPSLMETQPCPIAPAQSHPMSWLLNFP